MRCGREGVRRGECKNKRDWALERRGYRTRHGEGLLSSPAREAFPATVTEDSLAQRRLYFFDETYNSMTRLPLYSGASLTNPIQPKWLPNNSEWQTTNCSLIIRRRRFLNLSHFSVFPPPCDGADTCDPWRSPQQLLFLGKEISAVVFVTFNFQYRVKSWSLRLVANSRVQL